MDLVKRGKLKEDLLNIIKEFPPQELLYDLNLITNLDDESVSKEELEASESNLKEFLYELKDKIDELEEVK